MKPIYYVALCAVALMTSCVSSKQAPAPVESKTEKTTSLEGEQVVSQTLKMQGITMSEALNDDGTALISMPFKWYAGIGKADDKQVAIEIAQREAYATISLVLTNTVESTAEKAGIVTNDHVQDALKLHWKQVSLSIQKGCEPFGDVVIEYSPSTRMYQATAKVAVRGDRFNQMLNSAGNFKPTNLSGQELDEFIKANKAIMEAAKGN